MKGPAREASIKPLKKQVQGCFLFHLCALVWTPDWRDLTYQKERKRNARGGVAILQTETGRGDFLRPIRSWGGLELEVQGFVPGGGKKKGGDHSDPTQWSPVPANLFLEK